MDSASRRSARLRGAPHGHLEADALATGDTPGRSAEPQWDPSIKSARSDSATPVVLTVRERTTVAAPDAVTKTRNERCRRASHASRAERQAASLPIGPHRLRARCRGRSQRLLVSTTALPGSSPAAGWPRYFGRESASPALPHRGEKCFVEAHGAAEERGDGWLGSIARRSEAAGRDDRTGAVEGLAHRAGNSRRIVTVGGAFDDRHPNLRELAARRTRHWYRRQFPAAAHRRSSRLRGRGRSPVSLLFGRTPSSPRRRAPALASKIEPYRRRYRASE